MRRRSRLLIGSLLIGASAFLGIALTSTSATPALSVVPAEQSVSLAPHAAAQNPSGAAALMVLGAVVVATKVIGNGTWRERKGVRMR